MEQGEKRGGAELWAERIGAGRGCVFGMFLVCGMFFCVFLAFFFHASHGRVRRGGA
jgi:hypothetical protein